MRHEPSDSTTTNAATDQFGNPIANAVHGKEHR